MEMQVAVLEALLGELLGVSSPRVNTPQRTAAQAAEVARLLQAVQKIATTVASEHAADVDARGRFPTETFEALKRERVLSSLVSPELCGGGLTMQELGQQCFSLAQACGSSGMVLAMHHIQVACIERHRGDSVFLRDYLKELAEKQMLLASATSEVGTWGDTRSSICAVQREGNRYRLEKDATTLSYGAHADDILVTCRRDADAPKSDQVLVLMRKGDYALEQTTSWDTLGMRGTCSPGFKIVGSGNVEQIVPGSFADSSGQSMVPYSHILWSILWSGIAADAVARAGAFVRAAARKNPGTVPTSATNLAEVTMMLQGMKTHAFAIAAEFDALNASPSGRAELETIGWALKMNNLKVSSSRMAPEIVHRALETIGIAAYKNDQKFGVGRHFRDALSGALMINNDRVLSKSASMLLVYKGEQEG